MILLVVIYLFMQTTLSTAACQSGCICVQPNTIFCNPGKVDRIPTIANPSAVTKLELSNSPFSYPILSRSNFTGFANLELINLKGCGISGIEDGTFAGLTHLTSLDLSFNNLNIIPSGMLSGLRLEYLYMEHNPQLVLNPQSFSGMSTEFLNLQECGLSHLHPNTFTSLIKGSLRKLFLQGNQIERFPTQMLNVFQALESIRIYDNPLICDCESKWLKEFYDLNADTTKIRVPDQGTAQEPRCATPTAVAGRFFKSLSARDFACQRPTLHASITFTKEKGTLLCESRGNPLPKVTWIKPNGIKLAKAPQSNMVSIINELTILPGEPNLSGEYICTAANDGGNVSLTVNLDSPFSNVKDSNTPDCQNGKDNSKEVDLSNTADKLEGDSSSDDSNVFKIKYFTLVDIIGAILGTFVSTLLITVVTLHFCVYRRRKSSTYITPPMSEYSSSSNGSDKNGAYPLTMSSLHNTPIHQQHFPQHPVRPLPHKPFNHRVYDENHYMSTNIEEPDRFLPLGMQSQAGRVTPASSCDTCPACRTMPMVQHSAHSNS